MPRERRRLTLATLDNTPATFKEMSEAKPRQRIELIVPYVEQMELLPLGTRLEIVLNGSSCPCVIVDYGWAPGEEEEGIVSIRPFEPEQEP